MIEKTVAKQKPTLVSFMQRYGRLLLLLTVLFLHALLFLVITLDIRPKQKRQDTSVFKLVDVTEYVPPPPPPKEERYEPPKEVLEVEQQDAIAEEVIETEKEVQEIEIQYLAQHEISNLPVLPLQEVRNQIVYPPLANKQGIEETVYLLLYIDVHGIIRRIDVLKDPGYGFAEAAVKAFEGIRCVPALRNGVPVAVKIRYPLKFTLKR